MDPAWEEYYLQVAMNRPDILCSEVPVELLEATSSVDEPTRFLEHFFATGHTQWLAKVQGRRVRLEKDRLNNAIVVLWLRACHLHTSHILGLSHPDLDKPFFSDEGLYE